MAISVLPDISPATQEILYDKVEFTDINVKFNGSTTKVIAKWNKYTFVDGIKLISPVETKPIIILDYDAFSIEQANKGDMSYAITGQGILDGLANIVKGLVVIPELPEAPPYTNSI